MIRRFVFLIVAGLFIATGLISSSFAQATNEKTGKDVTKSDMMDKQDMMKKCPMRGMVMKGMMEKSIIATTEGGVIVLAGNKIVKYDKDLNVVKEVEIKVDVEAMQKNIMEMMKNCPMMKGVAASISETEDKAGQKK